MKRYIIRRCATTTATFMAAVSVLSGCQALGLGDFLWIKRPTKEENFWLVEKVCVSPSSSYMEKKAFDHNLNPVVNVLFTPKNEKNHYIAETMWTDSLGEEFRTIRTTHDLQLEGKKSIDRRNIFQGTPRIHTMPTKTLYEHKPGLWKVKLYLDQKLAQILEFSVR